MLQIVNFTFLTMYEYIHWAGQFWKTSQLIYIDKLLFETPLKFIYLNVYHTIRLYE